MKKILLILGILAFVAPVVADDSVPAQPAEPATGLDVSELIKAKSDIENGCSGDAFQVDTSETPLQMAAVYVDGCPTEKDDQNNEIGKYLYVSDNASIGNDGTISGVSCELCPTGHECPGISFKDIKINDNGVLSSQGSKECSKGMYSDETGLVKCKYCAAGTYQDAEGQTSCTPAAAGYYVEKGGSDVQIQCPVGYRDGITTGGTSIYSCQKEITQAMCNAEKNNFNTGTMTIKSGLNLPFLVNYRDLDNHCFGSLSCNSGYHKGNAWQWIKDNPGAIAEEKGCSINNKMTENGELVDCDNNLEPGTVQFVFDQTYLNAPMNTLNMVLACSDMSGQSGDVIGIGDAGYSNFTQSYCQDSNKNVVSGITSEADCVALGEGYSWLRPGVGGYCWMRNIDEPDQPWVFETYFDNQEACEAWCGANKNVAYPMVIRDKNDKPIVKDGKDNYYTKVGNNQFLPQIQIVSNTCYNVTTHEIAKDVDEKNACTSLGENWIWYVDGTMYLLDPDADEQNPVSNIGEITYFADEKTMDYVVDPLIAKTSGTNGNASFDVCVANPVNITWGDVTLEQNDPARTCTYGGDLITPTSEPASDGSRLFLGWKPVTSTPAP